MTENAQNAASTPKINVKNIALSIAPLAIGIAAKYFIAKSMGRAAGKAAADQATTQS